MKYLITGVAGLLGSRLAEWIVNNTEHEVVGIDDLSGGYIENVDKNVKFYKFDLVDLDKVNGVFKKEKPDEPPFDESLQQRPIDPYGIAKFAVEQDLKIAYDQHGLDYTIIRPHNFYGKNQNIWDKYRNVLGIWMYQLINDMRPTIFGDGEQKRAFSYVDDSIQPLWEASQNPDCINHIINLGGIKEYTINEACNTLLEVTESKIKPRYLEARHEVKYAWSTWEKSVDMLGFEHKIDLHDGLKKMWDWALKQPRRKRFFWSNYELKKGIYDFWKREE